MKKIGLVGGMSWVSSLEYYKLLNILVNEKMGRSNYAECILYSLNYQDIIEINEQQDWGRAEELFTAASKSLLAAGAECIILCSNTSHLVFDAVKKALPVPFIHIAEACADEILRQKLNKVALLGTTTTMEKDFFKRKLHEKNIEVIVPEKKDRDYINRSIFEELGKEIFKPETKKGYVEIIERLASSGAQGIILGCTEIPLLVKAGDVSIPVFDTTLIHARAAVEFACKPVLTG